MKKTDKNVKIGNKIWTSNIVCTVIFLTRQESDNSN